MTILRHSFVFQTFVADTMKLATIIYIKASQICTARKNWETNINIIAIFDIFSSSFSASGTLSWQALMFEEAVFRETSSNTQSSGHQCHHKCHLQIRHHCHHHCNKQNHHSNHLNYNGITIKCCCRQLGSVEVRDTLHVIR